MIATGVPVKRLADLDGQSAEAHALCREGAILRRSGSAALDLAYVAAGRLDGFWEWGLRPWDIAAGILLVREAGGIRIVAAAEAQDAVLGRASIFFAYLIALLVVGYLFGQMVALPLFIAAYLWRWGGYGWPVSFGYALAGWTVLYLFYGKVMNVFWHQPLLFG